MAEVAEHVGEDHGDRSVVHRQRCRIGLFHAAENAQRATTFDCGRFDVDADIDRAAAPGDVGFEIVRIEVIEHVTGIEIERLKRVKVDAETPAGSERGVDAVAAAEIHPRTLWQIQSPQRARLRELNQRRLGAQPERGQVCREQFHIGRVVGDVRAGVHRCREYFAQRREASCSIGVGQFVQRNDIERRGTPRTKQRIRRRDHAADGARERFKRSGRFVVVLGGHCVTFYSIALEGVTS